MTDRYNDATSERAYMYPMRQTGLSQPPNATLTRSTFGDYGNIHQGDHIINIEQLRNITNNYTYLPTQIGIQPTFDPHQDRPRTPCWTVPFGRNKDFVGRESILNQLLKMIPPNADGDDCQQTVISGLGGVGKTQIALEAAFRVRARCPDCHVFWVPAINTTTFENAYREIGRELNIQTVENDKADIKLLIKAALSQISESWLLIIDNADDTTLFGETSEVTSLRGYLPFNLKGSILFTTRNVEVSRKLGIRKDNIVHLTGMSQSEAINMLQKGLDPHQMSDAQSLESLLEFLANLPLAIKQASAYMIKTGIAISQYLEYCRSSDEALIELLSENFDDRARYETTQNPVATTWLISFRTILRDKPLAADYLRFMAFLAEKDIPKRLLPPASNKLCVYDAIGTLKAYGFISERECGDAYDMHSLVRLVMQNWMRENEGELQTHITKVMQRFDEEVPVPLFSNKDEWAKYLPHMTTALKFQDHMSDQILKSSILLKALYGLFILGKYSDAKEMNQRALDLHIKVLGDEHPSTLEIMDMSLAIAACEDQPAEIVQISKRVLELRRNILGTEHPHTLESMRKLSVAFYKQHHYEKAVEMSRQALDLHIKVLGAEHLKTLETMSTLSLALTGQGYDEEAEQISRQALDSLIETQAFGHPVTLACMSALSLALFSQSRYEECVQIGQQILDFCIKVLGAEHPNTFISRDFLSMILREQGRHKGEDDERILEKPRAVEPESNIRSHVHPVAVFLSCSGVLIFFVPEYASMYLGRYLFGIPA
ncbi:P-loop containing nucleoside triphosphate hydrolase protein [Trichoderma sp. SZMC 28011]